MPGTSKSSVNLATKTDSFSFRELYKAKGKSLEVAFMLYVSRIYICISIIVFAKWDLSYSTGFHMKVKILLR